MTIVVILSVIYLSYLREKSWGQKSLYRLGCLAPEGCSCMLHKVLKSDFKLLIKVDKITSCLELKTSTGIRLCENGHGSVVSVVGPCQRRRKGWVWPYLAIFWEMLGWPQRPLVPTPMHVIRLDLYHCTTTCMDTDPHIVHVATGLILSNQGRKQM